MWTFKWHSPQATHSREQLTERDDNGVQRPGTNRALHHSLQSRHRLILWPLIIPESFAIVTFSRFMGAH